MIDESVIATLKESLGDDGTVIRQLIDLYTKDSPQLLDDAAAALEQRDMVALARAAHSLKSTSASMGAVTVSDIARELEQQAKQNDADAAASSDVLLRLTLEVNHAIAAFARVKLRS